jgi:hypothetical protein
MPLLVHGLANCGATVQPPIRRLITKHAEVTGVEVARCTGYPAKECLLQKKVSM